MEGLSPFYESAEVSTMIPFKASDIRDMLLRAAKPYEDIGGRGCDEVFMVKDSGGAENKRRVNDGGPGQEQHGQSSRGSLDHPLISWVSTNMVVPALNCGFPLSQASLL